MNLKKISHFGYLDRSVSINEAVQETIESNDQTTYFLGRLVQELHDAGVLSDAAILRLLSEYISSEMYESIQELEKTATKWLSYPSNDKKDEDFLVRKATATGAASGNMFWYNARNLFLGYDLYGMKYNKIVVHVRLVDNKLVSML